MKAIGWGVGLSFAAFVALLLGLAAIVGGVQGGASEATCTANGPDPDGEPPLISFYIDAASKYDLGANGYAYLAAINQIETGFGTDMATSSAGAVGWMQFEPSTFKTYGVSVSDPSAPADPDDPQDAIYSAANYLHASGAPADWDAAIYSYNHSDAYVEAVEKVATTFMGSNGVQALADAIARFWGGKPPLIEIDSAARSLPVSLKVTSTLAATPTSTATSTTTTSAMTATTVTVPTGGDCDGSGVTDVTPVPGQSAVIMPNGLARPPGQAPQAVQNIISAGDQLIFYPYCYGGGHDRIGVPNTGSGDGSIPCASATVGYDCSGSTSAALYGAKLLSSPLTSDTFMSWGESGPGKWLTVYPDDGHVFFSIAGIAMDTVWFSDSLPKATKGDPQATGTGSGIYETGPRWQPISIVSAQIGSDPALGDDPRHVSGL